jgi:hypothetical protein
VRSFESGVTNPHPEFGFIKERTLREVSRQALKSPECLFCVAFGKKDLSLSEESRIVGLGLGERGTLQEEQE